MNEKEHLRQTLEYYRQQRSKKLEELRPIEMTIRNLEKELGETSANFLADSDTPPFQDEQEVFTGAGIGQPGIRPDEFFGMSHSEAAKAYLKKVGRAVSLDDLVIALKKGGAKVGGATPKKSLYVSLMRNPMREFVSPSENHIGLRSFYPGLPKTEKAKTAKSKKSKPAKKGRATRPAATAKTNAGRPPKGGLVKRALAEELRSGGPRTGDELARIIAAKFGDVPKIAVFGALRGKEFTREGGKYRLVQ